MVKPASAQHPSPPFGIFPELNTQCMEINRHCDWKHKCGFSFWTIILVLTAGMFANEICVMTRRYFEYNISLTYRVMSATSLEYPDFIICPLNALNITKLREEGFNDSSIAHLFSVLDRSYLFREDFIRFAPAYQKWLARKNDSKIQNLEQTLLYFALDPRKKLKYCEIRGVTGTCVPDGKEIYQFVSREGVCFMIEPTTISDNGSLVAPQQKSPGYTGNVGISLQKLKDEEFNVYGKVLLDNYVLKLTKKRFINSGDRALISDAIVLAPGTLTLVPITEKRIQHLDNPYSECINEQKMAEYSNSNYSLVPNATYSNMLCHRQCEAQHAMQQCNTSCILPGHLADTKHNLTVCDVGEDFECVWKHIKTANCVHCTNLCRYTTWTHHYSNVNMNVEQAFINIYHPEMNYILTCDTPSDPLSSLLGDIGGQLSLWLGCKIATIIQIVYYICHWMGSRCIGSNGNNAKVDHDEIIVGQMQKN